MSGGFLQKGAKNASAPPRPDVATGLALGVFAHGLQVCGWRSGVLQVCGLKHHGLDKFLGLPCFYLIIICSYTRPLTLIETKLMVFASY